MELFVCERVCCIYIVTRTYIATCIMHTLSSVYTDVRAPNIFLQEHITLSTNTHTKTQWKCKYVCESTLWATHRSFYSKFPIFDSVRVFVDTETERNSVTSTPNQLITNEMNFCSILTKKNSHLITCASVYRTEENINVIAWVSELVHI